MTSEVSYFYHAPDRRVYGPVSFQKLCQWENEGRIHITSRIQRKGEPEILTWESVKQQPPAPRPASELASVAPVPVIVEPPLEIPAPFPSAFALLAQTVSMYRRHFRELLLWSLALQIPFLPFAVLTEWASTSIKAKPDHFDPLLLWAIVPGSFVQILIMACLTLCFQRLGQGELLRPFNVLGALGSISGRLAVYFLCTAMAIGLTAVPAALFLSAAAVVHSAISVLLLLLGMLLLIIPVIFTLRISLAVQALCLEKLSVLGALKRSNTLIRYHPGTTLFSTGEMRILGLTLLACFLYQVFDYSVGTILNLTPPNSAGLQVSQSGMHLQQLWSIGRVVLKELLIGALFNPIMVGVFYFYFQAVRERLGKV